MKSIFLTRREVVSPRWQQAFADADIYQSLSGSLPVATESGVFLWWCLFDETQGRARLEALVAGGQPVVAMTRNESVQEARQAIAAGARGYLHYLAAAPLLQQVAEVTRAGGLWVGAELMRELVQLPAQTGGIAVAVSPVASLTPREQAVAEAVAAGHTNKEIARRLNITERTVKAHMGAIFEKLNIRDRLQLALAMNRHSPS